MKWLYLWLDLFTLFCPLVLSFEKRIHYFSKWKYALVSAVIIGIPFIIWDAYFTAWGFWGFNSDYLTGIYFFGLPLEEYLFFLVVPFACTFIYEVCIHFFSRFNLKIFNRIFQFLIPAYALLLASFGDLGYYTISVQLSSTLVLIWMMLSPKLPLLGLAFIISLLPFFLVNGILTGSFIEGEVVWYSEAQKVAPRLFTIPMEDILYSFTLVVGNMLVYEGLKSKWP